MLEIRTKLEVRRTAYPAEVRDQLELPFDLRQKTRLRTRLASGEEAALVLPRGAILRGGDLVLASDGRVVEVVAAREQLLHIEAASATELARCAYHLGNRHVPVEVGKGFLRLAEDHVLEKMLLGLGATVSRVAAPFEPEAGAYHAGAASGHQHPDGHPARIHDHFHGNGHDGHEH